MDKNKKRTIIAAVSVVILLTAGYFIHKQIQYNNSLPYVEEELNHSGFSKIEFLVPTLNENGDESAYVFDRYSSTSQEDIETVLEFINQIKYSDDFIEGNNVEVGVPRRLNLYDPKGVISYEIVFSKNMDSIIFPGEEVPRYARSALFQQTEILDMMSEEVHDIFNSSAGKEGVG